MLWGSFKILLIKQAVAVANLKARHQIAEFISTEITSNRFVTIIS
jgi:hypothetical protein